MDRAKLKNVIDALLTCDRCGNDVAQYCSSCAGIRLGDDTSPPSDLADRLAAVNIRMCKYSTQSADYALAVNELHAIARKAAEENSELDEFYKRQYERVIKDCIEHVVEIAQLRKASKIMRDLVEDIMWSHRTNDEYSNYYNNCEDIECAWCTEGKEAIRILDERG